MVNKKTYLHQIVAKISGVKKKAAELKTAIYQRAQKHAAFNAQIRTFEAKVDGVIPYQPEGTTVVVENAEKLIEEFNIAFTDFLNLAHAQDIGNSQTKVDVKVEEEVIIKDVPVTFLMAIDSMLVDWRTFINHLPVLDATERWNYDAQGLVWISEPKYSNKEQPVNDFRVVVQPTEHHPAEIREVKKNVLEGIWTTTRFSTALTKARKEELLGRINKLIQAVTDAREEANRIEVTTPDVATPIFKYLLG